MSFSQTGVPASTNFSSNGKLVFYLPFDGSSNADSVGGLVPVDPGQFFVIMSDVSTTPLTVKLNGLDITQTGNPQYSIGSDFSLKFPGTVGNYITFADSRFSASSWTNGFTLEAWVNYTNFTNVGSSFPVSFGTMSPTNSGVTGPNWSFGVNTSGRLAFFYYTTSGQTVTATSSTLSLNTFYHICVQCDTTNIYLYVNGVQVASQPLVLTPQLTSGINFTIGQYLGNAGPNFYVGDLRLVYGAAVYSVAGFTKPTTLLQNYTVGGATTALNLRNPNASNIQNPTFNTVNPKIGTASMIFNNVVPSAFANTFILYNQTIDICVSGYTIALWANVYTLPSGVGQNIMNTRGNTQYQGQIRLSTYGTIPSISYWNGVSGGGATSASAAFGAIAPNTWHHFAITIKPNGDISFYLDGTESSAGQNCQPTAYSATGGYMYGLFLGSSAVNPQYQSAMNGEIDDVRVYNFALSKSQITDIYNTNFTTLKNPISATLTGNPIFSQLSIAPVGAFSLRAVNRVNAKAVRVRNGTTSATQDFYADRLGNLLTAPVTGTDLATWLGGATGFVATWYDQSGAGNNFIQATAASQPQIVLNSGKWALFFNRDNLTAGAKPTFYSRMAMPNQISGVKTIFYVINRNVNIGNETLLGQSGVDNAGFRMNVGTIFSSPYGNDTNDFLYTGGAYPGKGDGYYLTYWYNNNNFGSSQNIVNNTIPLNKWSLVIGSTPGYTSFGFNSLSDPSSSLTERAFYGYLSEVVMFNNQISASDAQTLWERTPLP